MTIAVISMIRDAWGGSEELWYEMAKEALKAGHKVLHLAYEHPQLHPKMEELKKLGVVQLQRPGWVPPASPLQQKLAIGKNYFRKKLSNPFSKLFQHTPDVVIYNGTCYSIAEEKQLLQMLEANPSTRFFIIGHLNHEFAGGLPRPTRTAVLKAYQRSEKVFFVSKRSLSTAERQLAATVPNAAIIKNPVNLANTEALPWPSTEKASFALVGNLVTAHKGQDILLQALAHWPVQQWELNVYGSGPDEEYLKALAAQLNLNHQVYFHGRVHDVRKVWEKNQVLLMPSIMEGMPLAVVEAMLCGRFCLATDVGGHREWIEHDVSGYLSPAPTVHSLIQTLNEMWQQRDRWPQVAAEARKSAIAMYDPNAGATFLKQIT